MSNFDDWPTDLEDPSNAREQCRLFVNEIVKPHALGTVYIYKPKDPAALGAGFVLALYIYKPRDSVGAGPVLHLRIRGEETPILCRSWDTCLEKLRGHFQKKAAMGEPEALTALRTEVDGLFSNVNQLIREYNNRAKILGEHALCTMDKQTTNVSWVADGSEECVALMKWHRADFRKNKPTWGLWYKEYAHANWVPIERAPAAARVQFLHGAQDFFETYAKHCELWVKKLRAVVEKGRQEYARMPTLPQEPSEPSSDVAHMVALKIAVHIRTAMMLKVGDGDVQQWRRWIRWGMDVESKRVKIDDNSEMFPESDG